MSNPFHPIESILRRKNLVNKYVLVLMLSFILLSSVSIHYSSAQQGEWTWMSGSNMADDTAHYGTQGVPSIFNHPSALYEACEWTDTSGMFWLYGGHHANFFANLWRYNPATNEWTWVNGPGNIGSVPNYGTQGVASPTNTPGTRCYGATTFADKSNNLWLFGGLGDFGEAHNDLWKYDISTNEWTWMKGPATAFDPGSYGVQGIPSANNVPSCRSECAASWVDSSGNFWLFSGNNGMDGLNDLWRYNPATNEWTWMKGSSSTGSLGVYGTKGVANSTNCPGARFCYTKWNNGNDHLYLFGGVQFSSGLLFNDLWDYIISTNEWVWISGTDQSNSTANVASQCSQGIDYYPAGKWENRACWVDPCKKFWFFGGSSLNYPEGVQNDLWKFDPITLEWTWASGSLTLLQSGNFGTKGISSATNHPPACMGSDGWTDKQGNLWLFGGMMPPNGWNTMWRFVPDTSCSGSACSFPDNQQNLTASDNFFVNVFPNPSNGNFIVELLNCSASQFISLRVTNTLGQEIFSSQQSPSSGSANRKWEIDLHHISTGVYFVEIKAGNVGASPGLPGVKKKILITD